jgi:predicted GTPase
MTGKHKPTRIVIMGAAGRDFHNFNMVYRDDPDSRVIAFTANQIPDISGRRYPPSLAGSNYPDGIPIVDEATLGAVCREEGIDQVVFAYSDLSHSQVMHKACLAVAEGADFLLLGPETTRWLAKLLKQKGLQAAVIRHPMPYGDLEKQAVQRFANRADLDTADCTIEEREEYEPHLEVGTIVYAGVDYAEIVAQAEKEADIILWDGGNNDFSFIRPDLHIVLADPLRPGNETSHYPGEAVLRMADVVVLAKVNSAADADIQTVTENIRKINPQATIVRGASPVKLDEPAALRGKRVLVVEDGPTITHGGMSYGAGYAAATQAQALEIVDPRSTAHDDIAAVYRQYPHIGCVLPALGYHPAQLEALRETINASDADVVVAATPCDLGALIDINKPVVRAYYEFAEAGEEVLGSLIDSFLSSR